MSHEAARQHASEVIVPVILSGGSGTRLWPVSREGLPKQMWPLVSERTMLQETALRGRGPGFAPPVVVCNVRHRFAVAEQLREAGIEDATIVLEPFGRNSAPAVAAAALIAEETHPGATMWVMAADASITDTDGLRSSLAVATKAASEGLVVLFGMRPNAPETGFGYIQIGTAMDGLASGAFAVAAFLEKPDAIRAQELVGGGKHLWNSGMFLFRTDVILGEFEKYAGEVLARVRRAVGSMSRDADFLRLDAEAFAAVPNISLDYAIAEKTTRAAVVPSDFGWSDVGSWSALWEIGNKDTDGNVSDGDVIVEDARRCYVRSHGAVTAVVGLEDVVVVNTGDAVLVMHRDRAQDVKKVVDRLKAAGRREAVAHGDDTAASGHRQRAA
jgi:mannose-1-phosphate guanylyltransferase/mannose-6-phosphate isomerase